MLLASISLGDFIADGWRIGLTFAILIGLVVGWNWMLKNLGTF